MSDMYNRLLSEIKSAMIDKNNIKRDCLRSVVSDIKNMTVNAGKEITDDIVLKCIQKSVKQHNDSIQSFKNGGRDDLALKELQEMSYIEIYLPKMFSKEETVDVIKKIGLDNNIDICKKNMGQIMKLLPNNVDKKIASQIISCMG